MNGRERVKACLTFSKPDRAPRDLWALPAVRFFQTEELEELQKAYPMDIGQSQLTPGINDEVANATKYGGTYTDDWGCLWHVGEPGVIGEVKQSPLENWSKLDSYQPPLDILKNRDLSYVNRMCEKSDKFMLSDVTARPFERLQFLRGTEALFMDIAYGTAEFRKLLEMLHEFFLKDVESWCKSNVDGIFMMDDWGTNISLLISPNTWREVFKPLYKEYCDIIHAHNKFAMFHTDGYIESIYGDLIEVGMDAINSQLFCMDIEGLAKKYKGKVTFWGEMDRQHALPFGKPEDVRQAVMRVRRSLDDDNGGVMAQCEWGKNNPKANIEAVFKTWLEPLESRV